MSGFAAVVRPPGARVPREMLDRVAAALAFRGPDARATRTEGPAGLAHALLRTAPGDAPQPLTLDGAVWVVADARLDGRDELLRRLRGRGHPAPADAPDAALLLHAYGCWGDACVEQLIGDFAFAVWDAPRGRLFCARDHFGVVPFHYARVEGTLVASNTLDAVRAWPGVGAALHEAAVGDYLLFGYSADPARGFFADVHRLPPAHTLVFEGGAVRVARFWSPPPAADGDLAEPAETTVERFREAFGAAVADRARGGPLAVALSGGIDSPLVAAAAAAAAPGRLAAYTVGMHGLVADEEPAWARRAAEWIGVPQQLLGVEEWLAAPERAWRRVPEPRFEVRRAPGSMVPERVAAGGGRVVLAGFGGDVVAAAPGSRWAELAGRGRVDLLLREGLRHWLHFRQRPPLRSSFRRLHAPAPPFTAPVEPGFAAAHGLAERWAAVTRANLRTDPRRGMALLPFWSEMLSAMDPEYTGLPVRFRHPFFDVRVLHAALRTPPVPWLRRKVLLREAGRGALPPELLARPKAPAAAVPYFEAAVRGCEPRLGELAATEELGRYVDRARLLRAVRSPRAVGPGRYVQEVLFPVSLAAWLRQLRAPAPAPEDADRHPPVRS